VWACCDKSSLLSLPFYFYLYFFPGQTTVQKNFAERERERIIIRGFDNISRGGNIFFCVQDFVPFPYCTFSDVRWAVLGCAGLYLQPFFLFAGL
jgi:hypothetical protein